MEIPDKPPVDLLECQNLPILGTLTDKVKMLERKILESEGEIQEAATKLQLEREARGDESGMYTYLKPPEMPSLDELVGDRIDVCWPYVVGKDEKGKPQDEYCWCQGKVLKEVSDAPPTVKVLWDAMPDLDEDGTISNQELQPAKWKKIVNLVGKWRLTWSYLKIIIVVKIGMLSMMMIAMTTRMRMTVIVIVVTVMAVMMRIVGSIM